MSQLQKLSSAASLRFGSWNQIEAWLRQLDRLTTVA
jgi:hypothetical protein